MVFMRANKGLSWALWDAFMGHGQYLQGRMVGNGMY